MCHRREGNDRLLYDTSHSRLDAYNYQVDNMDVAVRMWSSIRHIEVM